MKKLLPLLLSYVLMQGQCFAISGGPDYGGSGHVSTTGSYSGIIQGVTEIDPSSGGAPAIPGDTVPGGTSGSASSNALGIFDLVVNGTTTSSGAFLLFADGVVFGGSISASVDPDSDKLSGILDGTFNFSVTDNEALVPTTTAVTATAVGMIAAKISSSGANAISAARLNGSANLEIGFGGFNSDFSPVVSRLITFTVSGFQTTTATNTASTIGTAGSAGTGGQTNG